jgi:hypothetical protein
MEAVRAVTAFRKRATFGARDAAVTAKRSSAVDREEGRHGYGVTCARAEGSDGVVKRGFAGPADAVRAGCGVSAGCGVRRGKTAGTGEETLALGSAGRRV